MTPINPSQRLDLLLAGPSVLLALSASAQKVVALGFKYYADGSSGGPDGACASTWRSCFRNKTAPL